MRNFLGRRQPQEITITIQGWRVFTYMVPWSSLPLSTSPITQQLSASWRMEVIPPSMHTTRPAAGLLKASG